MRNEGGAKQKRKVCIISANKTNKILNIAEEMLPNYQICHFLSPHCGIQHLLNNLHKKLATYTANDHCVILIGEEDFLVTKNYDKLITDIRNCLLKIQHTNIILCLPTYRCSVYSTLFNIRVETFNNALCLDVHTNKYATVLDSNLNLVCDYTMFSKYTGKINSGGIKNVFYNLQHLLLDKPQSNVISDLGLNNNNNNVEHNTCNENSKFFLF